MACNKQSVPEKKIVPECDRVCLKTFGLCTLGHVDWATCLLGADIQVHCGFEGLTRENGNISEGVSQMSVNSTRGQSYADHYEVMTANIQVTFEKSIVISDNQKEVRVCHFRDQTGGYTPILV